MLKEFREFVIKGNAIDLAVGVLIGAAFGNFVKAFTDGIITPIIRFAGGNVDVALKLGIFDVGIIINAAVNLLITGAVLFFLFVRPMNKLKALTAPPPPSAPPAPEVALLTEIRDLLKAGKGGQ